MLGRTPAGSRWLQLLSWVLVVSSAKKNGSPSFAASIISSCNICFKNICRWIEKKKIGVFWETCNVGFDGRMSWKKINHSFIQKRQPRPRTFFSYKCPCWFPCRNFKWNYLYYNGEINIYIFLLAWKDTWKRCIQWNIRGRVDGQGRCWIEKTKAARNEKNTTVSVNLILTSNKILESMHHEHYSKKGHCRSFSSDASKKHRKPSRPRRRYL